MISDKIKKNADQAIDRLQAVKNHWAQLPVDNKIKMLNGVLEKTGEYAQQWVDLSLKHKKLKAGSPYAGEEWSTGPWALAYAVTEYIRTLKHIQSDTLSKLIKKTSRRGDGQLKVKVFPSNFYENLLFNKIRGEVWMQKGITSENLEQHMASFYKQQNPKGKVCLVLSAGNINSIPPLDVLYKLFIKGEVVLLKMNPVNDYLIPVFEKIFESFITTGYFKIVNGGAGEGEYLTSHPGIDTIHITGSEKTHNAIVYGSGEEGKKRRENKNSILDPEKTITSELGGIGPLIVVPGPWSKADVKFQAENIVTAKLHNGGHNCVASQVLILPGNWDKSQDILDAVRQKMESLPYREAYYPGSADRQKEAMKAYPGAEQLTGDVPRTLITGIKPLNPDEYAFRHEFFGAVYAQTNIAGNTPTEYMQNAVRFCNEKLNGTLGATILIHPKTMKAMGGELENCIADLKYGTVAVNVWNAVAFLLPQCPWGAFPGHTYDDIQSGIGVVHNSLMFDKPEKTVLYGPFRTLPRALNLSPPRPPWFVTNTTANSTMKRITKFAVKPQIIRLPGILISALRG